jgi:hypothetical protein
VGVAHVGVWAAVGFVTGGRLGSDVVTCGDAGPLRAKVVEGPGREPTGRAVVVVAAFVVVVVVGASTASFASEASPTVRTRWSLESSGPERATTVAAMRPEPSISATSRPRKPVGGVEPLWRRASSIAPPLCPSAGFNVVGQGSPGVDQILGSRATGLEQFSAGA